MNRLPAPNVVSAGPVELIMSDVPAEARRAGAVRRALASWLEITAFDRTRIVDIALAVYEALANTVEHAYRNAAAGTMTVRAVYSDVERTLNIEVVDVGHWQTPTVDPLRGNGLTLISALSHASNVEHTDSGTRVTMSWGVETSSALMTEIAGRSTP